MDVTFRRICDVTATKLRRIYDAVDSYEFDFIYHTYVPWKILIRFGQKVHNFPPIERKLLENSELIHFTNVDLIFTGK